MTGRRRQKRERGQEGHRLWQRRAGWQPGFRGAGNESRGGSRTAVHRRGWCGGQRGERRQLRGSEGGKVLERMPLRMWGLNVLQDEGRLQGAGRARGMGRWDRGSGRCGGLGPGRTPIVWAGGWGGLCYQTNPSGVMVCCLPKDLLLILSPLQALLSQSQEADRASWVMLRLDGSEQDVCLQPPKQCALPPLSVFFRLYSVCLFFPLV